MAIVRAKRTMLDTTVTYARKDTTTSRNALVRLVGLTYTLFFFTQSCLDFQFFFINLLLQPATAIELALSTTCATLSLATVRAKATTAAEPATVAKTATTITRPVIVS